MVSGVIRSAAAVVILVLVGWRPAEGQRLSFAPQIGLYVPTQNLYELAGGTTSKLEAGPSFGARLGLWFGSRFGVEATGAYVPTTFSISSGSNQVLSEDARLFDGSGQAVFFLLPRTSVVTFYVSGGVGVISRGGVAFTDAAKTTDVAGVVGAGAGINVGVIALSVGADLFAYSAAYSGGSQTSESFQQRDLQLKLGLGIPFGGGAGSGPR